MVEKRRSQIVPAELGALVDFSERPRSHDWSLRAALTRYAQPQPMRVSKLLDAVRRLESALAAHTATLRRDGPDLWQLLQSGQSPESPGDSESALLVGLLRAAVEIDELGEVLANWAVNREGERPDDAVDRVTADLTTRLDGLGVAVEERVPPSSRRRS